MFAKMPRLLLTACIIFPSLSRALGLGEIHLNSALNEPLRAEIDLVAVSPEELTALKATLASRETFSRYGIERPAFVSSFTFKVAKSKDGRDVLQVRSLDSIPEPFVTFLVEVNWSRGRLMREYTVLLDPPVYTPGETTGTAAAVAAPVVTAPAGAQPAAATPAAVAPSPPAAPAAPVAPASGASRPLAANPVTDASATRAGTTASLGTYRAVNGDTLIKIAQRARGNAPVQLEQSMIAVYRANPDAFEGNINLLHRGAILRLPGADEIAAQNQKQAAEEIARQMAAWRHGDAGSSSGGRLKLVTPTAPAAPGGAGSTPGAAGGALAERVRSLESDLAESRRLIELRDAQLAALQKKLAESAKPATPAPTPAVATPAPAPATPPAVPVPVPVASAPAPAAALPSAAQPAPPAVAPSAAVVKAPAAPAASESILDWIADHWEYPAGLVAALLAALGFVAVRRNKRDAVSELGALAGSEAAATTSEPPVYTDVPVQPTAKAYVVEEEPGGRPSMATGAHVIDDTIETKGPMAGSLAGGGVSVEQGDPLAEADFHMAYGLYDQAADLVRMALEREPERRDLQMKLLEIYFVWGNADQFLQTARLLEASRDRAPAGEWEKVVIMGKQICPDEAMFSKSGAPGRGAGASVDLDLEGGENRIDIDLFGEPGGERSRLENSLAHEADSLSETSESPHLQNSGLDFMLDAPERGADPTVRRSAPAREEPTVESEQLRFGEVRGGSIQERIAARSAALPVDQTAELAIDDLGLDLDSLESTDTSAMTTARAEQPAVAPAPPQPAAPAPIAPAPAPAPQEDTQQMLTDGPTVVAGMDEHSRRLISEAEARAHDGDLTQLERELEASFIAELSASNEDIQTSVIEQVPSAYDPNATAQLKQPPGVATDDSEEINPDSTAQLRSIKADSVDLDFDALPGGHTDSGATQAHEVVADDIFAHDIFEDSQRIMPIDLSAGETVYQPNAMLAEEAKPLIVKLPDNDVPADEFEPVTMSEVGTKLDLARAYMDMGDPEGARSILEEVVQEGSATQKQEAERLLQSLPG